MLETISALGFTLVLVLLGALVLGTLLLWRAARRLDEIRVPPGASFWTTVRAVPFGLVAALDLLDFALDFLSVPIVWVVLSRYNLQALRNVAAVEALIPFTQPIPSLTLAWVLARLLDLGEKP